MKARTLLVSLATVSLISACGTGEDTRSPASSPTTQASGGMAGHDMSPDEMAAMGGPSQAASMICSDEIRTVVQRTFDLARQPQPIRRWSPGDLTLTCDYRLPGGTLRMTVQDAPDKRTGRPHFARLRANLAGASAIHGVQSLGFPAFETPSGSVVFLKDGKTLRVDADDLNRNGLPAGFTRAEAAYGVAAAVIACWTE